MTNRMHTHLIKQILAYRNLNRFCCTHSSILMSSHSLLFSHLKCCLVMWIWWAIEVMTQCYVQVLGHDTGDSSASLFVFFGNCRYTHPSIHSSVHPSHPSIASPLMAAISHICWLLLVGGACDWCQRYLINVGEGTQRLCSEHRVRLHKVRHIFLTRLSNDTLGGLGGTRPRTIHRHRHRFSPSFLPSFHHLGWLIDRFNINTS
jgi:hypothetical protein